jgi:hypothetical protein
MSVVSDMEKSKQLLIDKLKRQYSFGEDLEIYDTDFDFVKKRKLSKIAMRDKMVERHLAEKAEQERLNKIYTEQSRIKQGSGALSDEEYFWFKTFFTG